MPNIPRRKIYETLLEYEDGMISMQILLYNEENFKKYLEDFNKETYKKLEVTYRRIKALLIMFIDNKKYRSAEEFEAAVNALLREEKKSNWKIFKNRNFPVKFKLVSHNVDKIFQTHEKVDSLEHGKEMYKKFDAFNHFIPTLLELRRDHMK